MMYLIMLLMLSSNTIDAKSNKVSVDLLPVISVYSKNAKEIARAVEEAAETYHMDAYLITAVIAVESGFNAKAVGTSGEIGLMQLHPRYHGKRRNLRDIRTNILLGTAYLAELRSRFEDKYTRKHWIECYNRGPRGDIRTFPYASKVLAMFRAFSMLSNFTRS